MNGRFRFTPSRMTPDLLERLFVGRELQLEDVMSRIAQTTDSTTRNHTLLVGQRGSGKTHLLSIVHHRTVAQGRIVSWLPEDPWTIATYEHLMTEIVANLDPPAPGPAGEPESVLRKAAVNGPVVVFVENLDEILDAIGNEGQQRLRHLLQDDRSLLLVATTTSATRDLVDQASPFYSFFTTSHLDAFDLRLATEMLVRIAEEDSDEHLVAYLRTAEGQARLATIEHLVGGRPRIWAMLAAGLDVNRLRELVDLLLERFDDLTPYYQEQLKRLSPHQRRVVAHLTEVDRPLSVSTIAEAVGIEQRSLGKTISELTDRAWVEPTDSPLTEVLDKRRTYYEIAEPLARIALQIKSTRGQSIPVAIDFLKAFFERAELGANTELLTQADLKTAIDSLEVDTELAVTDGLQASTRSCAPIEELLGDLDDALASLEAGDPEPALALPSVVRRAVEVRLEGRSVLAVRLEVHQEAKNRFGFERHERIGAWVERAHALVAATTGADTGRALLELADWLARAGDFDEAKEVLSSFEFRG